MVGRVTSLMISQNTLNEINQAYTRLANTQQELSSGKKINQPSDDPYGASRILQLQGDLGNLGQYNGQINDGIAWTQTSQTALTNTSNAVQRVRELAVGAANSVLSQADMTASAAEVDQLISTVQQEANTQYNGQYLFSGTSNARPYQPVTGDVYQGNSGAPAAINRLIGPGVSVKINADLSSVLGSGQSGSGGPDGKLLDVLRTISADMKAGNSGAIGKTDLANLDTNFNALTQMEANTGAITNRLQLASSRIQSMQSNDTQSLSGVQDADMAQAEIDYSMQQAAFQASLKAGATIVQQTLMDFLK